MELALPFEKTKREVLTKKQVQTDTKFGCRPDERLVDDLIDYGIINLNKPKGPTSHQTSEYVQKILGIDKSGHSGTLDPNVTGVLPIATGRATRIVQYLLKAGKEYVCLMHLHTDIDENIIRKTMEGMVGEIEQIPPIKSSVKRQKRKRSIYYIGIYEIKEKDVLFRIGCQAGTYIRKFCHDLGKKLGTGAHMAELIRTKAGPFTEETMVTLQDLEDALWYYKNEKNEKFIRHCIKPVEYAVRHLPKVWVFDSTVDSLCHGAKLAVPGISKVDSGINPDDVVAVMTLKDELIAIGNAKIASEEIVKQEKGIAVDTKKVFMKENVYPKIS